MQEQSQTDRLRDDSPSRKDGQISVRGVGAALDRRTRTGYTKRSTGRLDLQYSGLHGTGKPAQLWKQIDGAGTLAGVFDGASNTYLCGEKYLNSDHYASGNDPGDDLNMYVGFSDDNHRWTDSGLGPPMRDRPGLTNQLIFGSAHHGTYHTCFADGSVHPISYEIDPEVHSNLGNRADGKRIPQHLW